MPGFGERLKSEREAKNRSIEDIGVRTGIERRYLEALENEEFQALPGRAFGKLYIRAYAEILGFDPQPLIDQYDRERHRRLRALAPSALPEPEKQRPVKAALGAWRESKRPPKPRPVIAAEVPEVEEQGLEWDHRDGLQQLGSADPITEPSPGEPETVELVQSEDDSPEESGEVTGVEPSPAV